MSPQYLRTATPMGDWRSFKFTVAQSGGVEDGKLILIVDTVCVCFLGEPILDSQGCRVDPQVVAVGEECVGIYHAEKIRVAKQTGSGNAFLVGQKVYWSGVYGDAVSPIYTSGYYWIGICVQPADEDDEYVVIDLKGDKATLLE